MTLLFERREGKKLIQVLRIKAEETKRIISVWNKRPAAKHIFLLFSRTIQGRIIKSNKKNCLSWLNCKYSWEDRESAAQHQPLHEDLKN